MKQNISTFSRFLLSHLGGVMEFYFTKFLQLVRVINFPSFLLLLLLLLMFVCLYFVCLFVIFKKRIKSVPLEKSH